MATNILGTLGSSSGLDTQKLVSDLVAAQKAPQQGRIDSRDEQYTAQLSAYGQLKSGLSEFQNVLTPLADPNLFDAKSINVPTTDVVSFNSLTAQAPKGSYQLEVIKTASAQSLAFNTSQTNADTALGKTETLTFKTGEWTYNSDPLGAGEVGAPGDPKTFSVNGDATSFDIEITADDTLNTLAKKINDAEGDATASVVNIAGTFQLLVNAESGKTNSLEVTSDSAIASDFEFNSINHSAIETSIGSDSEFKLNGLSVTRSSNTISDVIEGLNFTLDKADEGNPVSFSINEDKGTAEQAIRAFVTAYNLFQDTVKPLVGVKEDEDKNLVRGDLANDGTAKNLYSRIKQVVASPVNGLSTADQFSTLASIGILTDRAGKLEIKEEDFSKAIADNFSQISELFGTKAKTSNSNISLNTGSFASKATSGTYTIEVTQAPKKGELTSTDNLVATDHTDGNSKFKIAVDGVNSSSELVLSGNHSTLAELAAEMQNAINSDSAFTATNIKVDVSIDTNNALVVTSRAFGSNSKIDFSSTTQEFRDRVGITDATTGTIGVDVEGRINGEAAFGSSNVLLPSLNSPAYGLNFTVKENTSLDTYTASFTRGLAGDLSLLASTALADKGQIANKEELITNQKKELKTDQENLDRKMTAYQERLSAQYAAMERVVASLNQTKSQLTGLIDRLPFTAPK